MILENKTLSTWSHLPIKFHRNRLRPLSLSLYLEFLEFPFLIVASCKAVKKIPFSSPLRSKETESRRPSANMPTTSAVEESRVAGSGGGCTAGEIMLFGVRVVVDSMRKSVSLNNLAQYEQPHESLNINNSDNIRSDFSTAVNHKDAVDSGYASADDAGPNPGGNRERKRGVPWTEEEHKLFLLGLQKVGKGDWRGISRDFVKTRTPTQVASHAQKYFIRRSNLNRRRRRSSLFDITTDTVSSMPLQEEQAQHCQEIASQSHSLPPSAIPEPSPVHPISAQSAPCSNLMADLNLNLKSSSTEVASSGLSLRLSLTLNPKELSQRHPGFEAMPSFTNGDNIISVS